MASSADNGKSHQYITCKISSAGPSGAPASLLHPHFPNVCNVEASASQRACRYTTSSKNSCGSSTSLSPTPFTSTVTLPRYSSHGICSINTVRQAPALSRAETGIVVRIIRTLDCSTRTIFHRAVLLPNDLTPPRSISPTASASVVGHSSLAASCSEPPLGLSALNSAEAQS
ncbi:hypothetical protein EJ02DRAFT_197835 [Clathrospora elynae]|uniref:Uncharacterized protein n=1 Tax=Clathrospora elynae TaxID=706981 RepID=A0A6A5T3T9_9PLEO|nr:hypothetical protein EJ02DRAFT_197835 [Clathrospora elynae]